MNQKDFVLAPQYDQVFDPFLIVRKKVKKEVFINPDKKTVSI